VPCTLEMLCTGRVVDCGCRGLEGWWIVDILGKHQWYSSKIYPFAEFRRISGYLGNSSYWWGSVSGLFGMLFGPLIPPCKAHMQAPLVPLQDETHAKWCQGERSIRRSQVNCKKNAFGYEYKSKRLQNDVTHVGIIRSKGNFTPKR
jgi:hypothetical protein